MDPTNAESMKQPKSIEPDEFTVHEAIESIGFGKFQYILCGLAGIALMADSMEIMLLSLLSPSLECEWGITPAQQALSATCVFMGWMIGAPVWGWFCDRYGRRKGLFVASVFCLIFAIATALSQSFIQFVILRAFVGFGIGGMAQICTICTEFLPTSRRAQFMLLLQSFFAIGAAAEAIVALIVTPAFGWRWLIVASSTPLFIFALVCVWLPESARFFISHDQRDDARKVLERIAAYNNKTLRTGRITLEKSGEDEDFQTTVDTPNVSDLLAKPLLITTILVWIIWMINTFSYYGLAIYTTKLFQSTDKCHGGRGMELLGNETSHCVMLKHEDYVDIIKTSFSELPGLIFTLIVIERLGRKKTMALEFGLFAILNYVLYFCLGRQIIVILLFAARAFAAGAFQATYVYTPEVYPTSLRALGIGASSSFGRLGAMITPYVAQVIADYNLVYATFIYGTGGVIGAVAAILLPIETTGRAMRDTIEMTRRESPSRS